MGREVLEGSELKINMIWLYINLSGQKWNGRHEIKKQEEYFQGRKENENNFW